MIFIHIALGWIQPGGLLVLAGLARRGVCGQWRLRLASCGLGELISGLHVSHVPRLVPMVEISGFLRTRE